MDYRGKDGLMLVGVTGTFENSAGDVRYRVRKLRRGMPDECQLMGTMDFEWGTYMPGAAGVIGIAVG
jgi:hypothetical protein